MSANKYLQDKLGLAASSEQLVTSIKETYDKNPGKAINFIRPLIYYQPYDRTLIPCLFSSK